MIHSDSEDNLVDDDSYNGEDYYSGDDAAADAVYDNDSGDLVLTNRSNQKNYTVLREEDLLRRQEDDITRVSAVISLPRDSTCMLLLRYNWNVNYLHEAWFADEHKVRETVGLLDYNVGVYKFPESAQESVNCGICFESYQSSETMTCGCDHSFCKTCFQGYISMAINDGPGCLILMCPDPGCRVPIGPDMVDLLGSEKEKERYHQFLLRSYIESNKKIKWCPFPGCDYAVELDDVRETGSYDVSCFCKNSFCWNCLEEVHRPVDCETVGKWLLKNSSEAENTKWILAYTKPCPHCGRSIEKNDGCMHMTCRPPCGYEFCWLCLESWTVHGYRRACNGYNSGQKGRKLDETVRRREMAKKSVERYTHYYERWAANQSSRVKALSDLHKMETLDLRTLGVKYCQPESQLEFIKEAWLQIVECRRVLKWTYAYGYYLPEKEQAKRQFFEYVQGEAETGLERLHKCAEKELQLYLISEEADQDGFNDFRGRLIGLTKVTCTYFENLVRALENGLSEVDSHVACNKSAATNGSVTDVDVLWECDMCASLNTGSSAFCKTCYAQDIEDEWDRFRLQ